MDQELLLHLVKAVDRIETKLAELDGSRKTHEWLSRQEFLDLAGISEHHLKYAIQKGRIHGDAIRNVGTAKRARLRFHRTRALDQFLNRVPA